MARRVPRCALDSRWRELKAKAKPTFAEENELIAVELQRNVLAAVLEEQRTEGRELPHRRPNFHE